MLYIHFTVLARGGRRPLNILKKGIGDYENVNASGDIQNANRLLDLWMTSLAGAGFSEVESANNRMSETRLFSSEAIKAAKMEELYRRAYKILYDNRDFLLAVQKELLEHETLLNSDLAKILESCT